MSSLLVLPVYHNNYGFKKFVWIYLVTFGYRAFLREDLEGISLFDFLRRKMSLLMCPTWHGSRLTKTNILQAEIAQWTIQSQNTCIALYSLQSGQWIYKICFITIIILKWLSITWWMQGFLGSEMVWPNYWSVKYLYQSKEKKQKFYLFEQ